MDTSGPRKPCYPAAAEASPVLISSREIAPDYVRAQPSAEEDPWPVCSFLEGSREGCCCGPVVDSVPGLDVFSWLSLTIPRPAHTPAFLDSQGSLHKTAMVPWVPSPGRTPGLKPSMDSGVAAVSNSPR
ncbi:hypothetical protein Mapa_016203 [Marchantia paleacea]|nr:hypothetical protein Mapa_016203 [Marchantia paleacea]